MSKRKLIGLCLLCFAVGIAVGYAVFAPAPMSMICFGEAECGP